jgi:hypothetical protein
MLKKGFIVLSLLFQYIKLSERFIGVIYFVVYLLLSSPVNSMNENTRFYMKIQMKGILNIY